MHFPIRCAGLGALLIKRTDNTACYMMMNRVCCRMTNCNDNEGIRLRTSDDTKEYTTIMVIYKTVKNSLNQYGGLLGWDALRFGRLVSTFRKKLMLLYSGYVCKLHSVKRQKIFPTWELSSWNVCKRYLKTEFWTGGTFVNGRKADRQGCPTLWWKGHFNSFSTLTGRNGGGVTKD
jgi:hypothetical protein